MELVVWQEIFPLKARVKLATYLRDEKRANHLSGSPLVFIKSTVLNEKLTAICRDCRTVDKA